MVNPKNESSITVVRYREVARLGAGASFGELALLKTAGRSATIQCCTETRLATLHQYDYLRTMGQQEKRKLKQMVNFFRGFRIFANLRVSTMERIFLYMRL